MRVSTWWNPATHETAYSVASATTVLKTMKKNDSLLVLCMCVLTLTFIENGTRVRMLQ